MKSIAYILLTLSGLVPSLFAEDSPSSSRESPNWFHMEFWRPAAGRDASVEIQESDGSLKLAYSFSDGGRYIGVYRALRGQEPFSELRFEARSSQAGTLLVRIYDNEDETLQYAFPISGDSAFYSFRIRLDNPSKTFPERDGAVLNREVEFPIKGIFFGFEAPRGQTPDPGTIEFTKLEIVR